MADKGKDDAASKLISEAAAAAKEEVGKFSSRVLEAVNSDATFDGRPDEVTMLTALVEVQTREFLDWGLEAVKTYLSKAAK